MRRTKLVTRKVRLDDVLVQNGGSKTTVSLLDFGEGQGGVDLLAYLRHRVLAMEQLGSLRHPHSILRFQMATRVGLGQHGLDRFCQRQRRFHT